MSVNYLIASLPPISLDRAPALKAEAFLEACREQLAVPEARAAEALLLGKDSTHPFVRAWRDKETLIRNAVARARGRKLGVDAGRFLRPAEGCDLYLNHLVEEACQAEDPLKRERAIDLARCKAVEELQATDPLDITALFAYAVKLGLALKWASLDTARGKAAFDHLTQVEGLKE